MGFYILLAYAFKWGVNGIRSHYRTRPAPYDFDWHKKGR
jgi:hypothetical protein